jgi:hypothetical protein
MSLTVGELIAQLKAQGIAPGGSGDGGLVIQDIDDIRPPEKETISQFLGQITKGDTNLETKNVFTVGPASAPGELGTHQPLLDPEGNPAPLHDPAGVSDQTSFIYPNNGDGYQGSGYNSTPSGGASPEIGQPELEAAYNSLSDLGFFTDLEGTDGPFLDKNAQTEGHYILNAPDTRDKISSVLQTTRFGLIAYPDSPHSHVADGTHTNFVDDSGMPSDIPNLSRLRTIAAHYQASGEKPRDAFPDAQFVDANGNPLIGGGTGGKLFYQLPESPPLAANGMPVSIDGTPAPADGSPASHGVPHTMLNEFRVGLNSSASAELETALNGMLSSLGPALSQLDDMLGTFGPSSTSINVPDKPWDLPAGSRYGSPTIANAEAAQIDPATGTVTSYPSGGSALDPLTMLKTLGIPIPVHVMGTAGPVANIITTAVKYGVARVLHSTLRDPTAFAHWRIIKRRLSQQINPSNNDGLPTPPPSLPGVPQSTTMLSNEVYMQEFSNCAAIRFIRMFCIMSEPHAAGSILAPGQPYRFSGRKDLNERLNAGPQRLSLARHKTYAKPQSGLAVKNIPSMMLLPKAFVRGRMSYNVGGHGSTPTAAGSPTSAGIPSLMGNKRTAGDTGPATNWKNLLQAGGADPALAGESSIALRKKLGRPLDSEANRFSREEVNAIENALEAEHMPFYFHDLRTNEVIAFHAFLGSLSDSYSPSFKSSSGFGRIEDVQIYEKTTRSISVSFIVAAMNSDDMDEMYWKINKLVSMIYPQFSRGTMLEHVGQDAISRFVQPFSQIPTASPVIRLRVGDLIKGNYNRDGIRRLMGVQDPDFVVADPLPPEDVSATMPCSDAIELIYDQVSQVPIDASGTYNTDDGAAGWPIGSHVIIDPPYNPVVALNSDGVASSDWGVLVQSQNTKFPVKILAYHSYVNPLGGSAPYDIVITVELISPIPDMGSVCGSDFTGDRIATRQSNGSAVTTCMLSYTDILHHETAQLFCINGLNSAVFPDLVDSTTPPPPVDRAAEAAAAEAGIRDVLFGDKNPIFQSFETTTGRGLAGVITSFDIDWMLNTATWETTPGKRAPTMCTINIGFTPIHDIVPGLDSDGMMRAVNYNIGGPSREIAQDPHGNLGDAIGAITTVEDPY